MLGSRAKTKCGSRVVVPHHHCIIPVPGTCYKYLSPTSMSTHLFLDTVIAVAAEVVRAATETDGRHDRRRAAAAHVTTR